MSRYKRLLFLGFCTAIFLVSCRRNVQDFLQDGFDKVREYKKNVVLSKVLGVESVDEITDKRVYMSSRSYSRTEITVKNWREEILLPYQQAWIFFIDDEPMANWEHSCRYVFVDHKTDEYKVVQGSSPLEINKIPEKIRVELEEITEGFEERQRLRFEKLHGAGSGK